jgi:hypothetical protein
MLFPINSWSYYSSTTPSNDHTYYHTYYHTYDHTYDHTHNHAHHNTSPNNYRPHYFLFSLRRNNFRSQWYIPDSKLARNLP